MEATKEEIKFLKKMKISVIIPAFNEEKYIVSCLEGLVNQRIKEKFEVILVDNNSTDRTQELARKYIKKLPLKIVVEKKRGRGSARGTGFKLAKGEILISTDADCVVPPNWIQTIVHYLENEEVVAVTGVCKFFDGPWSARVILSHLLPLIIGLYRLVFGHYWLSGYNFAIKRWVYLKSGGFNANLNAQEDTELAFRVKKIGRIKFLPNLPVLASGRRFNKGVIYGLISYLESFSASLNKKQAAVLADIR